MEFLKKVECFFIQLQYCLTVEPEPILIRESEIYSLTLKPDVFFKLISDFQIEYPFIPANKIIELKGLMNKEGIKTNDALKVIENYKKQYWFLNVVIIFEPVTDILKRTLKRIDGNISEHEINIELINFHKHLQGKREKIYFDLVNEIQGLPPRQSETRTEQPTENDFTLSTIEDWLFEFKEKMNEADYQNLVSAFIQYFETGKFPILSNPIQINGRPNKKLFGWALNRIFEAKGKGVEKELLQFAKQNISLFTDVQFDENNILKSNLYKYFTTQTK